MIVMVDESTGEKYARSVSQEGLGEDGELEWLVEDMQKELRNWGHTGGEQGHLIFKSDGESSIKAVRDRLAKKIGGRVVLEQPAQGESQSNGTVEEAGKTIREFVRLLKDVLESNLQSKIGTREPTCTSARRRRRPWAHSG